MWKTLGMTIALAGALGSAQAAQAQASLCEDDVPAIAAERLCPGIDVVQPAPPAFLPVKPGPLELRMLKYVAIAAKHRLCGLASYYSASLDGSLTANGERYRNKRLSAAHLTLPLGSWIEVTSRATGRKIRCRVNDRGPYVSKFMLDLSYAAAHSLGVDVAEDRHVDVRLIALPGEEPLPDTVDWKFAQREETPVPVTNATVVAAR